MKIILVAINAKYIHSSLAVHSVAAYLTSIGKNVHIQEFTANHKVDLIVSELHEQNPDILAFSCYVWNIDMVLEIADTFKKIRPDIKIIAGGPEVTAADAAAGDLPGIDAVLIGEGVPLVDIPFPYQSGFEEFKNRIIYYESSRGCVNNCGYCLSSTTTGVQFLPLERIKKELDIFLSAKVPQVKFVDCTFNCDKRHSVAIWEYLIKNDNNITNFHFEIAADLLDDEMITLIEKARQGLFQFEIGVQSTNPATLSAIRRTTDTSKLLKNVTKLKTLGNVHLHLDLIVGLPHENHDTFIKSFNDVMAVRPDKLQVGFLKLLKGTDLRKNASKYGIKYTKSAPYEILSNDFLDYETINKLKKVENMVDIFYNSGNFASYIKFMMNSFLDPYSLFEALAAHWYKNGYHLLSHKKTALYTILYEFGIKTESDKVICELLKYDMLTKENIRTFPDWIAKYYSYDHKKITRTTATHTFSYDIRAWLDGHKKNLVEFENSVLFEYNTGVLT